MSDKEKLQLDVGALRELLKQIDETPSEVLSCEETYRVLDEYVDRLVNGEPVDKMMSDVKYHLDMCVNCGKQFEILCDIIRATLEDV